MSGPASGRISGRVDGVDVRSSHDAQLTDLLDCHERGERPETSGPGGRLTLELITGLYKSALTGRPVDRDDLRPDDPFYHRLHGDTPGWAPREIMEGRT